MVSSLLVLQQLPGHGAAAPLLARRSSRPASAPRTPSSLSSRPRFQAGYGAPLSRLAAPPAKRSRRPVAASSDGPSPSISPETEVFQGVYGPWSIDSADIREVFLYRAGLVTTSIAFVSAASRAFLPRDSFLYASVENVSDILYGIGAGGLGISLLLIHIYVTPIKRALQLLWGAGVLGSLVVALKFAAPEHEGLVDYVVQNPWAIWLVGPLFAALTGLVFKEGLCYGKLEAAVLVFVIPSLLLGHLSGLSDGNAELLLLLVWISLFIIFTARKFTQPIKDDLGDKSIFMFNALPEEEKESFLMRLQTERGEVGKE